jgi:hypothetical protein
VNKNARPVLGENQIRRSGEVAAMQPKPEAQPMYGAAHKQLGQRITLANGPHHRATRIFREVVHYNSPSALQRCWLESRHLSDTDAHRSGRKTVSHDIQIGSVKGSIFGDGFAGPLRAIARMAAERRSQSVPQAYIALLPMKSGTLAEIPATMPLP